MYRPADVDAQRHDGASAISFWRLPRVLSRQALPLVRIRFTEDKDGVVMTVNDLNLFPRSEQPKRELWNTRIVGDNGNVPETAFEEIYPLRIAANH